VTINSLESGFAVVGGKMVRALLRLVSVTMPLASNRGKRRERTPAQQMEMRFEVQTRALASKLRRYQRMSRAHWWFQQMHRMVDDAFGLNPASPGQDGQIQFPLSQR
jgi:hypothetical protein